jgi:hypothetical protein
VVENREEDDFCHVLRIGAYILFSLLLRSLDLTIHTIHAALFVTILLYETEKPVLNHISPIYVCRKSEAFVVFRDIN